MKIALFLLFLSLFSSMAFASDYCLAHRRSGAEGAPKFWFQVDCSGGETFSTEGKWCWSLRESKINACIGVVLEKAKATLAAKGYTWASSFLLGGHEKDDHLFIRSGANETPDSGHCLAMRYPTYRGQKAAYTVNCGDDAITRLENIDDGERVDGISKYMQANGYSLRTTLHDSQNKVLRWLVFGRISRAMD